MVLNFKVLCSETRIDSTWFFGHATGVITCLQVATLGSQVQGSVLGDPHQQYLVLWTRDPSGSKYTVLYTIPYTVNFTVYRIVHSTVYREVPGTSSSRNLAIIMVDILRPPAYTRKGHVLNSPTRRDPPFLGPGADVAVGT